MAEEERQNQTKAKLIAAAVIIVTLFVAFRYFNIQERLIEVMAWIDSLGVIGPLIFIVIYIIATVLFIPGSVLTLGAGATMGLFAGFIVVSVASTLGAGAAFLAGRYLARSMVEKKLEEHHRFKAIDEAVATDGWKIVFLTRLSPIFPFNLLNYAYGVTRVSFGHYFLASWIGMMPGTLLYVYMGSLAGDLATLQSDQSENPARLVMMVVGFIATLGVTFYITRIARRSLAQKIGPVEN